MISYCLGFAFTDYDNFVVLIRKTKPAWQKGLLNGVGGKIEEGEFSHIAMAREFKEETGIDTGPDSWTHFTEMKFPDVRVHCFATRLTDATGLSSLTEEQVGLYSIVDVRNHPKIVPNLRWLVPMAFHALDHDDNSVPHTLDHE